MTKREAELELQVWRERAQSVQNAVQGLNVQAQLLSIQSGECKDNIARCEAQLADVVRAETPPVIEVGQAAPAPDLPAVAEQSAPDAGTVEPQ